MIAFTADNHIGITNQWSIKDRGADFLASFKDMVDKIVDRNNRLRLSTKTLIIGGDLFNTPYPASFAVEFVQKEVKRLNNVGCAVYGIDGNHDIADSKWLRVCGIIPLTSTPVTIPDTPLVKVCGIGYRRSTEIIDELNAMVDRGVKCDILVLHLAFGEMNRMGATSDISAGEIMPMLKEMGTRMVLMGHIHIRQSVTIDGVTFAYCGSTELCSMNEQKDKSFELIDQATFAMSPVRIKTREVESVVISTEEEFAKFEANIKESDTLYSMYVTHNIKDGVKRLRDIAKNKNVLMRIQIMQTESTEAEATIDRTTGVIGLEQAIGLSFKPDSVEAELIRAILRSPESLKMTVDSFIKSEVKNDAEKT